MVLTSWYLLQPQMVTRKMTLEAKSMWSIPCSSRQGSMLLGKSVAGSSSRVILLTAIPYLILMGQLFQMKPGVIPNFGSTGSVI